MQTADDLIVIHPNPLLRKKTSAVPLELIGGTTLSEEIKLMKSVFDFEKELLGVALSAPQVGMSRRMFVVSGDLFGPDKSDQIIINPEYIKTSQKTELSDEGCLSIPYVYGKVKRHKNITIKYIDEQGESQVRGAGGFLSFVIQHEMDHLDGVLFIDKAQELEKLTGRDRQELERRRRDRIDSYYGTTSS